MQDVVMTLLECCRDVLCSLIAGVIIEKHLKK